MTPRSESAFDLTTSAGSIQPSYGFYAIFFVIAVVLIIWAALAMQHGWRGRKRLTIFAAVWLSLTSYISITDAKDVFAVRREVVRNAYTSVEGCLAYFHPGLRYGSKTMAGDERWSVAGYEFAYGAGEIRPGYHLTEPNGGVVHRDTKVRVSFVISPYYGRTEIVRLIVTQGVCPPAPDKSTV